MNILKNYFKFILKQDVDSKILQKLLSLLEYYHLSLQDYSLLDFIIY